MRKPPLVEVAWTDAIARVDKNCTISAVKDVANLARRSSVGYLVFQDEIRTVLARDFDAPEESGEEATVGDFQVIPTGWITKIRHTRKPPKVKDDGRGEAKA